MDSDLKKSVYEDDDTSFPGMMGYESLYGGVRVLYPYSGAEVLLHTSLRGQGPPSWVVVVVVVAE